MVSRSKNSLIYGFSWYLDEVADDWLALVLGDFEAGWPLPFRIRYGLKYGYQPPFCQQLGVFYNRDLTNTEIRGFYDALPRNFLFFDYQVNFVQPPHTGFDLVPLANFELNLAPSFSELQSRFSSNINKNSAKAERSGCQIFTAGDPWEVAEFYERVYNGSEGRFTPEMSAAIRRLTRTAQQYGYLLTYQVFDRENTLCAGALILVAGTRLIYLIGGANKQGKQLGAMHFLFSKLIEEYAGHGYLLDFEGSRIPGVADFFRQFGAEMRPYFRFQHSRWQLGKWWLQKMARI